jgi:glycosyltransferase involved in cell wall biosynthesis
MKLISLIIPCYNEAQNIQPLYKGIVEALEGSNYSYELLFVDDGSGDETLDILTGLKVNLQNPQFSVTVLQLSRNFGKEIALTAGLDACQGEAAIMIDADLQQPPECLPQFIAKWEQGADVVVGHRKQDKHYAPLYKRLGSKLFYKLLTAMSETPIEPGATDFRLVDRVVINEFKRFTERRRLTRGLIDWLGFERDVVYFQPNKRAGGTTGYPLSKLVGLAITSFTSNSLFPLRLTSYIGSIITLLSGLLGIFVIVESVLLNDPWNLNFTGTACLGILTIFLIGIVMMALGLIALYIATIHTEVINRPLYAVRKQRSTAVDKL